MAVEEQFYLLYPLLLAWLWMRRNGPRFIWLILSVISCASIATNIYLGQAHPAAAFYLLPSRAWELLLGGLVALAPAISSQYPRWITESAAWLGIAAILGTVCLCDETMRFPFAGSLLSCLGTAAFLHANTPRLTSAGRILAWGPFTYVGAISYSLYLWHWPLLVYARYWSLGELRLEQKLGLIAICFGLGVVTWKFVETPFRRGVLSGRNRIVWTAIAVSVGFALVGSILYSSAGDGG